MKNGPLNKLIFILGQNYLISYGQLRPLHGRSCVALLRASRQRGTHLAWRAGTSEGARSFSQTRRSYPSLLRDSEFGLPFLRRLHMLFQEPAQSCIVYYLFHLYYRSAKRSARHDRDIRRFAKSIRIPRYTWLIEDIINAVTVGHTETSVFTKLHLV